MKYICIDCNYETESTEKDFTSKGEPVCPNCNSNMGREEDSWGFAKAILKAIDELRDLDRVLDKAS